jgi:A/G-specific adenine glycosylase
MSDTLAKVQAVVGWFRSQARDLPWRGTTDPYAIWVSEVMLQQTQVTTVVPYYRRWLATLPTIRSLAEATEETVLGLWAGLGYYSRARHLHRAAQRVAIEYGGRFPRDFAAILSLPGIGRYTAGAICSLAFNQPAPILDGNVARVLARVLGIRKPTGESRVVRRLWAVAEEWVTTAARLRGGPACGDVNQGLMELGATVCVPRTPSCGACPLRGGCAAERLELTAKIPVSKPRPRTVNVRRLALVLERSGNVYIRRRLEGETNAGLWEFPSLDLPLGADARRALSAWSGVESGRIVPVARFRHAITHHRIHLEAYRAVSGQAPSGWRGEWKARADLSALALSSAHRRIAAHLVANGGHPAGAKASPVSVRPR